MIARLFEKRLDMVVGNRIDCERAAYCAGHRIGNMLSTVFVASTFGSNFNDLLSPTSNNVRLLQ